MCIGPYCGPMGGAVSYERGTPVDLAASIRTFSESGFRDRAEKEHLEDCELFHMTAKALRVSCVPCVPHLLGSG